MCVICVKPKDVLFPPKNILENCFNNNNHGAGFMYLSPEDNEVHFRKGYDTFEKFYAAVSRVREQFGDDIPYIMHFRISTQCDDLACTHPFPLSSKMDNLKKLKGKCSIGVAHNGVISLTSTSAKVSYSDTMLFITDYLSRIIQDMSWHTNKKTKELIELLIGGSRLAFLDKTGHIEMLGSGWVEDKETKCFFSNSSYSYSKTSWWDKDDYYYGSNTWVWSNEDACWHHKGGKYRYDRTTNTYVYLGKIEAKKKNNISTKKSVKQTQTQTQTQTVASTTTTKQVQSEKINWSLWKDYAGEYDFTDYYCPYTEEDDDSYCSKCMNFKKCRYTTGSFGQDLVIAKTSTCIKA